MSKPDFKPTTKAAASTEFIEHADLDAAALGPREEVIDVIADGEREVSPCPAPPRPSPVARVLTSVPIGR